jgi:hypothetical protein
MKKKVTVISTFIILSYSKIVSASGIAYIPNPTRINSLEELISFLAGLIRPVFLVTFLGMVLYGAFVYLTARDSEENVKKARQIIIAAIIGFAIAVFAPDIIALVTNLLGIQNSFDF